MSSIFLQREFGVKVWATDLCFGAAALGLKQASSLLFCSGRMSAQPRGVLSSQEAPFGVSIAA
jgi:hypothetical protein